VRRLLLHDALHGAEERRPRPTPLVWIAGLRDRLRKVEFCLEFPKITIGAFWAKSRLTCGKVASGNS